MVNGVSTPSALQPFSDRTDSQNLPKVACAVILFLGIIIPPYLLSNYMYMNIESGNRYEMALNMLFPEMPFWSQINFSLYGLRKLCSTSPKRHYLGMTLTLLCVFERWWHISPFKRCLFMHYLELNLDVYNHYLVILDSNLLSGLNAI